MCCKFLEYVSGMEKMMHGSLVSLGRARSLGVGGIGERKIYGSKIEKEGRKSAARRVYCPRSRQVLKKNGNDHRKLAEEVSKNFG